MKGYADLPADRTRQVTEDGAVLAWVWLGGEVTTAYVASPRRAASGG